jgi:hypothetical protein
MPNLQSKCSYLIFIAIICGLLPWVLHGLNWNQIIVNELDHCEFTSCDFVRHYLPQAQQIASGEHVPIRGWFYPPLFALLLYPFTYFHESQATLLWESLNLLAVLLLSYKCSALFEQKNRLVAFLVSLSLTSTSLPILHCYKWGQIGLVLTLLLIHALSGSNPKRGLILGLAASLKAFPIFFCIVPLLRKQLKYIQWVVLSTIGLGLLLPALALGTDGSMLFIGKMLEKGLDIQYFAPFMGGQSLSPVLFRFFIDGSHTATHPIAANPLIFGLQDTVYYVLLIVVFIVVSVPSLILIRSNRLPPALSLSIAFCWLGMLLTPGWHHYFCFLPFCQAAVLRYSSNWTIRALVICSISIERIPVLLLGQIDNVFFWYSAYGGTLISVSLCWFACLWQGYSTHRNREGEIDDLRQSM